MLPRRFPVWRSLAVAVLAALALFCLGDLVHAASMHASERGDHAGRVCGERGCEGTAFGSPFALAAIASEAVAFLVAPAAVPLPGRDERAAAPDSRRTPHAPRSPPLV